MQISQKFAQPKHLDLAVYRKLARGLRPIFLFCGLVLSGMMLMNLAKRRAAGETIESIQWVAAVGLGFLHWGLWLVVVRWQAARSWLIAQDTGLVLKKAGMIPYARLIAWAVTPSPLASDAFELRLIYQRGKRERHWTMLLDDDGQISKLKVLLKEKLPLKERSDAAKYQPDAPGVQPSPSTG